MNTTVKKIAMALGITFLGIILWPYVRPWLQKIPLVGNFIQ
jgi:hypothetical protein